MSYGRKAPKDIPQPVWDEAIDLWLNLATADSNDIKTIADRLWEVQQKAVSPRPEHGERKSEAEGENRQQG